VKTEEEDALRGSLTAAHNIEDHEVRRHSREDHEEREIFFVIL
jgi:hypothetical protein